VCAISQAISPDIHLLTSSDGVPVSGVDVWWPSTNIYLLTRGSRVSPVFPTQIPGRHRGRSAHNPSQHGESGERVAGWRTACHLLPVDR